MKTLKKRIFCMRIMWKGNEVFKVFNLYRERESLLPEKNTSLRLSLNARA